MQDHRVNSLLYRANGTLAETERPPGPSPWFFCQ